jgi:plastocyanin
MRRIKPGSATIAAALAAGAVLATPAAGVAAQLRFVMVLDTSLKPSTVTVPIGGSPVWLNVGRRSHRITSDTNAWPAFALLRGKRHSIRFTRTGRYRYRVDGKRKGLIIVVALSTPGGNTGGETWAGTFTSADTNVGTAQTCHATWRGKLTFTISGGRLGGNGDAFLSSTPSCSVKLATPEISRVTFTLSGKKTAPTIRLLMHPKTIHPSHAPVYDAGGFLLHFGTRGEGVPFVLRINGANVDADVTKTVANVTLRDHFRLVASK